MKTAHRAEMWVGQYMSEALIRSRMAAAVQNTEEGVDVLDQERAQLEAQGWQRDTLPPHA